MIFATKKYLSSSHLAQFSLAFYRALYTFVRWVDQDSAYIYICFVPPKYPIMLSYSDILSPSIALLAMLHCFLSIEPTLPLPKNIVLFVVSFSSISPLVADLQLSHGP